MKNGDSTIGMMRPKKLPEYTTKIAFANSAADKKHLLPNSFPGQIRQHFHFL